MDNELDTIGKRIEYIINVGIEQNKFKDKIELAEILHIAPSTIDMWITNEQDISFFKIIELCNIVKCHIRWLAYGDGNPNIFYF